MWRNYLTVALRSLAKNRAYALINILGLAVGMAACLTIFLYVGYERGYDRWLPESERIYQVQATWREPSQPVSKSQHSPFPVRDTLPGGFPQVEAMTVLRPGQTVAMRGGQPIFLDAATVDPSFFDIFQLEFVDGSRERALPDIRSVVLTESEALKQLGTAKAAGMTMTIGAGEGRMDYAVSGVIRDLPKNSSLRLAVIFRFEPSHFDKAPAEHKGWGAMDQMHFVKLREGADADAINAALPAWEKRTIAPQMIDGRPASQAEIMDLKLVPIGDVHLGEAQLGALTQGGDPRALATFVIVALLTLGMGVINFVNLSTARASLRAREVALRKVLGATRGQLVAQFLGEALLMAAAATLVALAAVELATPWIGAWVDADLGFSYFGEGGLAVPALGLMLATGLLGGLYPALYLSRFRPAAVLRANASSGETPGSGQLRAGLVVLQFAISIGLIVCTSVIYAQTRHIQTVDPGYRRDGLIQIDAAWRFAGGDNYEASKREMLAVPGVVAAGRTNLALAAENKSIMAVRAPGSAENLSIGFYGIDPDFFRTMEMRLLAGRFLGEAEANDRMVIATETLTHEEAHAQVAARGLNIVVNRNAARMLGYRQPAEAVGKTVRVSSPEGPQMIPATIAGVVEDTRIRTARDAIEPLLYAYDPRRTSQVVVRYQAARPGEVMAGLNRVWRRFEPEIPFQGRFAEDLIREIYAADRARGQLFAAFSALAVIIACLGLYSLASFATQRRTKEIGIRKVVGARIRHIVQLLVWQFSKPVILANLVAWPAAWWAMRDWLNDFDTRIALTPGPFVMAGVLALAIALGTIAGHALKVARSNPIHALRYE